MLAVARPKDHVIDVLHEETHESIVKISTEEMPMVHCFAFSPNGLWIAAVYALTMVRVWDIATATPVHDVQHDVAVYTIQFSRDSSRLLTSICSAEAYIWDLTTATAAVMAAYYRCKYTTYGMSVSAYFGANDEEVVLFVKYATIERVWSGPLRVYLANDAEPQTLEFGQGLNDISCIHISSSGSILAAGLSDLHKGEVAVMNLQDKQVICVLHGPHKSEIECIVVDSAGTRLICGDESRNIIVWNITSEALLQSFNVDKYLGQLTISSDGSRLAYSDYSSHTIFYIFDSATESYVEHSQDRHCASATFSTSPGVILM
jgi:WD40 repeat protein